MNTDDVVGLYIHTNDSGDIIFYTNPNDGSAEGDVYTQNTELQIKQGRAISTPAFTGFAAFPRVFNGTVDYTIGCL